jgi:hypothetical protein
MSLPTMPTSRPSCTRGSDKEQIPTLAFLKTNPGRARTHAAAIQQLLRETRNAAVWTAAFDVLSAADANRVDQIYSAIDQATALTSWPGEIIASFIARASAAQFAKLRQWQLEPQQPAHNPRNRRNPRPRSTALSFAGEWHFCSGSGFQTSGAYRCCGSS